MQGQIARFAIIELPQLAGSGRNGVQAATLIQFRYAPHFGTGLLIRPLGRFRPEAELSNKSLSMAGIGQKRTFPESAFMPKQCLIFRCIFSTED